MCRFDGPPNMEYVRDLSRGRLATPARFMAIDDYAYSRWMKARDMKHARQWHQVMEAVQRRGPDYLRYKLNDPPWSRVYR